MTYETTFQSKICCSGIQFQRFNLKLRNAKQKTENLENVKKRSADRVREHLANERTYLAWMRSGIALMGFGVLIVRLRILRPPIAPQPPGTAWKLGLAFALVGLLTVLFS